MSVVNVQVVRPKRSLVWFLTYLAVAYVLGGLVVTWLAAVATGGAWEPGYWQSVAIYVLARVLLRDDGYLVWTEDGAK